MLRRFESFITEDPKEQGSRSGSDRMHKISQIHCDESLDSIETSAPQLIRWTGFSEDGVS